MTKEINMNNTCRKKLEAICQQVDEISAGFSRLHEQYRRFKDACKVLAFSLNSPDKAMDGIAAVPN